MKISPRPLSGNMQPDLFSWALQQPADLTFAGRHIANRFGLPPYRAELIARLAGFKEVQQ